MMAFFGFQNNWVWFAFLTGGFFSGLCGFLGMNTATNASSRTAQGASISLNRGLQVAFRSGAVMGLVVVGFGLLDISLWYMGLNYIYDNNIWQLSESLVHKIGIAGGVFDIGDHILRAVFLLERFDHVRRRLTAGLAADIGDKKNSDC